MSSDPRRALVLFSGGQDSTVCLAYALERYAHVETIGFDYGQRQPVELECRLQVRSQLQQQFARWSARLGDDHVLDLSLLDQIGGTAPTAARENEMNAGGLPNSFVPGRNLLFFTFAATVADRRGLRCWSAACARPTSPATPTAATTRSSRCRSRSASAWTRR